MPRSRPASNPLSFHKPTAQFYVTRGGKRIYLGVDREQAMEKYHLLALGRPQLWQPKHQPASSISAKELANRFLEAQQANWRNPEATARGYREWLGRFLADHPGLRAEDLTVEMFAAWKLSLRRRGYSAESINHYLGAVRAVYRFAEDTGLIDQTPPLRRVRKEPSPQIGCKDRPLYSLQQLRRLLAAADLQMRGMILLGLNCGFGPKDIHDLTWSDIDGERVTLPRSKTGVCQTFLLWPETQQALQKVRWHRSKLVERMAMRGRQRSDDDHVFITRFWRPWNKDAVREQFAKLCAKAGVPCYGFYRLRHCASTAMSLVANPHVQRRFMRHSQLQQQVAYTHTPDAEVDAALMKARDRLLGEPTGDSGSDPEQVGAPSLDGDEQQARAESAARGTPAWPGV